MKNKVKIINSSTIGQEGRYLKTSGGHKIHLPKQSRISYTKMILTVVSLVCFENLWCVEKAAATQEDRAKCPTIAAVRKVILVASLS